MPEARYYTVTQERQVKVTANSAIDAARIASTTFNHGQTIQGEILDVLEDVIGNVTTPVRIRDISVREDF